MQDEDLSAMLAQAGKTKEQLIELVEMRKRIAELEASETQCLSAACRTGRNMQASGPRDGVVECFNLCS